MNKKEFENNSKPYVFFMGVDPETGECNYEYLEGWDWSGYMRSIIDDHPQRFFKSVSNKLAHALSMEAHGITGLPGQTERIKKYQATLQEAKK